MLSVGSSRIASARCATAPLRSAARRAVTHVIPWGLRMRQVHRWVPVLPRPVWALLGGEGLAAVGSGVTWPFLFLYFIRVRGLDVELASLALAVLAAVAFVGNPLAGWASDRIGARRTLVGGLVMVAVGALAVALVREPWHAFVASALLGFGASIVWPAQDALLAAMSDRAHRTDAFSMRYATMNLGMGVGSVCGALLADLSSSRRMELLFVAQSVLFLAYATIASRLPNPRATRDVVASDQQTGGYRRVLGDLALRRLLVLVAVLFAVGYAQYYAAFPAFAVGAGGLGVSALGVAFAANTCTIVAAQLLVLRLLAGWRRSRALALVGVMWAAAWAVALAAGALGGGLGAAVTFAVAMALFGLGETALAPALAPLVNDLATDELRGRYNGASALASTTGFMLGPALAGLALGTGLAHALLVALVVVCLLAALGALRLERWLPSEVNRPAPAPAPPLAVKAPA
jgi:MFS family permease